MHGDQPLYRQTNADESWWPEGGYVEFRYTWPWRTWLRNCAVIAAIVLGLMSLLGLLGDGDIGFGFSFGLFMLLFIGVFYAPFFLVFQLLRPVFTYLRVGPQGIEWRDDILGERRSDRHREGNYYISPILGFRPRRLRWEDMLCVAVPQARTPTDMMRIAHTGPASPAFISTDGLRGAETLFGNLRQASDMRDLHSLPDPQAKRVAVFLLNRWDIILEDPENDIDPQMVSDYDRTLDGWEMAEISRGYQVLCRDYERLISAERQWLGDLTRSVREE